MTRKQRRLTLIGASLGVLGVAAALVLISLRDTIVFFHPPSEVVSKGIQPGTRFRLGGLVQEGSVQRGPDQTLDFVVADASASVKVHYQGLIPDLFREGQGVVAEGMLEPDGRFRAETVLAKHDENYMPREVADALKKQGVWQHDKGGPALLQGASGTVTQDKATPAAGATQ
jgi:cytochrome c-type biogenesis protein CcmE